MWKSSHLLEDHGLKGRMRTVTFINISVSTFVSIHVKYTCAVTVGNVKKELGGHWRGTLAASEFFSFQFSIARCSYVEKFD